MLASLLPGLREVRVPLTVGYLWLLVLWLAFGHYWPTERPEDNELLARLFDLHELAGMPLTLAAISFAAYVVGALAGITPKIATFAFRLCMLPILLPVALFELLRMNWQINRGAALRAESESEIRSPSSALSSQPAWWFVTDWSDNDIVEGGPEYDRLVGELRDAGIDLAYNEEEKDQVFEASRAKVAALRVRLLVANQELYGEYDRFAAEAAFRINLWLPFFAFAVLVWTRFGYLWCAIGLAVAGLILLYQGLRRLAMSTNVLMRAVLAGVITHPVDDIANRFRMRLLPETSKVARNPHHAP
jgi:hypothetical protein